MKGGIILFDGSTGNFDYGTKIPKMFCKATTLKIWGFSKDHIKEIRKNMKDENTNVYWEQWDEVVRDAEYTDKETGIRYVLKDAQIERVLWMVPVNLVEITV